MANPQAENGHVDIANEIMEAFCRFQIPSESRRVLDFILRKTYGWHKKRDSISLTQFVDGTGLKRNQVCRSIKRLISMNLIIKGSDKTVTGGSDNGVTTISTYEFQKDFEKWGVVTVVSPSDRAVTKGSDKTRKKVVTRLSHTKENIQKKTNKRNILPDDEWILKIKALYNWVDWDLENRKMDAWLLDNPHRIKTRAFIKNWLNKKQKDKPVGLVSDFNSYFKNDAGNYQCKSCGKTYMKIENLQEHFKEHNP